MNIAPVLAYQSDGVAGLGPVFCQHPNYEDYHIMKNMTKKALFGSALLAPLAAMAGTDTTFATAQGTLTGWMSGSLGVVLSLAMVVAGIGAGILRQSITAVIVGLAAAIAFQAAPAVLTNILTMAL